MTLASSRGQISFCHRRVRNKLFMRLLRINTRIICIFGLTVSMIGAFLLADWQSIPNDPCTELSLFHNPELADQYRAENALAISPVANISNSMYYRESRQVFAKIQVLQSFEDSVYNVARNRCEEARFGNHRCHWIPDSIVSKELCADCQPICRSVDRSLNFIQFLTGATVFQFAHPIVRITVVAILSAELTRDLHGIVMGFVTAFNQLSIGTAPLWLDASYEGVGKRTFLPMSLVNTLLLPFMVGLIILYPKLGLKLRATKGNGEEEKEAILEATNEEDATELSKLMTERKEQ